MPRRNARARRILGAVGTIAGVRTTLLVFLVAAALSAQSSVFAAPSGDLASQAGELRASLRGSRAEMRRNLAEYARITSELTTTHADVERLSGDLHDLKRDLKEQRAELHELARARYESGGLGLFDVVLGARSWQQLVTGFDYLTRVAQHSAEVASKVKAARDRTEETRSVLESREERLVSLRRDLKTEREKIEQAMAAQEASLDAIDARVVQLVNEQERAAQSGDRGSIDVPVGGDDWIGAGTLVAGASASVDGAAGFVIPKGRAPRYETIGLGFDWLTSTYGNADNSPPGTTASASTRPFLESELTCANKILPFGTLLAVTYNGRRVVVVVSDRGPYIRGRSLDLSTAAARTLGLSGVETVHAEIVLPEG